MKFLNKFKKVNFRNFLIILMILFCYLLVAHSCEAVCESPRVPTPKEYWDQRRCQSGVFYPTAEYWYLHSCLKVDKALPALECLKMSQNMDILEPYLQKGYIQYSWDQLARYYLLTGVMDNVKDPYREGVLQLIKDTHYLEMKKYLLDKDLKIHFHSVIVEGSLDEVKLLLEIIYKSYPSLKETPLKELEKSVWVRGVNKDFVKNLYESVKTYRVENLEATKPFDRFVHFLVKNGDKFREIYESRPTK